jgi:phosphate:Na+ symporter
VNQLNAAKGIELLAAQRWLDRLVAHTYRFSNVLYESILKNEERKFKNGC